MLIVFDTNTKLFLFKAYRYNVINVISRKHHIELLLLINVYCMIIVFNVVIIFFIIIMRNLTGKYLTKIWDLTQLRAKLKIWIRLNE